MIRQVSAAVSWHEDSGRSWLAWTSLSLKTAVFCTACEQYARLWHTLMLATRKTLNHLMVQLANTWRPGMLNLLSRHTNPQRPSSTKTNLLKPDSNKPNILGQLCCTNSNSCRQKRVRGSSVCKHWGWFSFRMETNTMLNSSFRKDLVQS